jgi:hypothetical protein
MTKGMKIDVCLWVIVAAVIGLSACADLPSNHPSPATCAYTPSQIRTWQYSHAKQRGRASSLLDSPNDPPLSDQELIAQSNADYIRRGFDPKRAEQGAKKDYISATGRNPTPAF